MCCHMHAYGLGFIGVVTSLHSLANNCSNQCLQFVVEQLLEPAFAYVSDNWDRITDIGLFLWKWIKIIVLCYVVITYPSIDLR